MSKLEAQGPCTQEYNQQSCTSFLYMKIAQMNYPLMYIKDFKHLKKIERK